MNRASSAWVYCNPLGANVLVDLKSLTGTMGDQRGIVLPAEAKVLGRQDNPVLVSQSRGTYPMSGSISGTAESDSRRSRNNIRRGSLPSRRAKR